MPTSTVEDYLKGIYLAQQRSRQERIATGAVAAALEVTPGTATTMIKALADAGLVAHEPYAGVRLTPAGIRLAARVVRRHRLIEVFLVQVLGMSWSEVHVEAEILEHAVSDRLVDRMDAMLGHPTVDPHGDPIPSAEGEIADVVDHLPLAAASTGVTWVVARVADQNPEFLTLLERHALVPGARLTVDAVDPAADVIEIRPEGGPSLRLGLRAAGSVFVERVAEVRP